MPKSIRSWGPSDPIPRAGLTPFPSLKKWEDPWEAGLDLVNLRGNAAEFDTIRQLSEDSPHGDPVPVVDPGQIDKLTASIELDDAKSAILRSDARLIAAWYELPKHQAHIFMGRSTLLDALEEAASKVRDLDEWLAPFVYETEELLQVLPAEVVGSRRDFDVVGLSQKSAEFSRLVDSILRFSRPPKRKPDSRRNVAIALAVWAVEDATGEAVTKKGQSRRGNSWHFTNRSGVFVRDLMKLLGWPDERVIVGAVEKLMREPRIAQKS